MPNSFKTDSTNLRYNIKTIGEDGRQAGIVMEADLFALIVEVEKEIEDRLVAERNRAAGLVEEARRETGLLLEREEAGLRAMLEEAITAAGLAAENEAAAIVESAQSRSEELARLDDATLLQVLRPRLQAFFSIRSGFFGNLP